MMTLLNLRRNNHGTLHIESPSRLLKCSSNGDCELQILAARLGLREVRYGFDGDNILIAKIDDSNPSTSNKVNA